MSTTPVQSTPHDSSTTTGVFAAASGYPSGLERVVESTKDGLDGRGAGGVLRISDSVTLILGDCLAHLPIAADAVVTDPPYGIGHFKGVSGKGKHTRRNAERIGGDDEPFNPDVWLEYGNVLMWGADHYAQRLPRGRWLVWDKLNGLPSFDSFSDVEVAWHNRTGAARIYHYMWKGICQQGDKEGGRVHPTQKPVPLMAWCLEQAGVPIGATVLDPYMGSGTTGIACLRTGRKFIGIERDPKHFETACQRIRRELEECVFEFPKGQDGGESQQVLELEPRQTDNSTDQPTSCKKST